MYSVLVYDIIELFVFKRLHLNKTERRKIAVTIKRDSISISSAFSLFNFCCAIDDESNDLPFE